VSHLFQTTAADSDLTRRSLNYLAVFRIGLAAVVVAVAFSGNAELTGPEYKHFLARAAGLTYVGSALAFAFFQWKPIFDYQELARFSLVTDIVLLLLVLHCFGGLSTGLAILLIFVVGISGLLLPLQTALFFASLISLGIILEAWIAGNGGISGTLALQAGIYGIATFVTALACSLLGRWGREYQLLAERRRDDLVGLEQVNDLIIRRMRSGVMVVDSELKVRQMNESAWYLLGSPPVGEERLKVIAPPLVERLELWRKTGRSEDEALLMKSTQAAVVPQFVRLPGVIGEATLIFLEDTSVVSRRARDLAQASLARLSASIAHEIRNPLGALSHAAQLLGESPDLQKQDKRLVQIIHDHTVRMNDIVENVLKLSRRERASVENVNISDWIRGLGEEFRKQHELPESRVRIEAPRSRIEVMMDPTQLQQAVSNLMENALRHASSDTHQPTITLRLSPIRGHREMALDIIDDGPGIPLEKRSQIFEPFFTTHKQGSGLGLFLARQLCDASQAPLEYVQIPNAGACFRILLRRVNQDHGGTAPPRLAAADA
jgi:two-component system sensor histidine kinase PilS (NtrC family)